MKNIIYLLNITIMVHVLSASKCPNEAVIPDSCTECPTITSISPHIGFAGDSVKIVGAKFKGLKAVYFGEKEVTSFNLSSLGDTITVEVPQAATGKEKDSVVVSVLITDPNKTGSTINSNAKGSFKYAEISVEEYAGKSGVSGDIVNVDSKQARFNLPKQLTTDKDGNLYFTEGIYSDGGKYIKKIDNKTGVVSMFISKASIEGIIQIGSGILAPLQITIDKNNNLYIGFYIYYTGAPNYYTGGIRKINLLNPININNTIIEYNTKGNYFISSIQSDNTNSSIFLTEYDGTNRNYNVKNVSNTTTLFTNNAYSDYYFIKNDMILPSSNNITWYNNFVNPKSLFVDNEFKSISSLFIDNKYRLWFTSADYLIIKPNYKAINNKQVTKIYIPTFKSYGNIVQTSESTYYLIDTFNHRILKLSIK